jgi:hypothetical protein
MKTGPDIMKRAKKGFSILFNILAHNITFDPDTSDSCFIGDVVRYSQNIWRRPE